MFAARFTIELQHLGVWSAGVGYESPAAIMIEGDPGVMTPGRVHIGQTAVIESLKETIVPHDHGVAPIRSHIMAFRLGPEPLATVVNSLPWQVMTGTLSPPGFQLKLNGSRVAPESMGVRPVPSYRRSGSR